MRLMIEAPRRNRCGRWGMGLVRVGSGEVDVVSLVGPSPRLMNLTVRCRTRPSCRCRDEDLVVLMVVVVC